MSSIHDLVNAVLSKDTDSASAAFTAVMQEKIADAIEVKRVDLAQTMFESSKSTEE